MTWSQRKIRRRYAAGFENGGGDCEPRNAALGAGKDNKQPLVECGPADTSVSAQWN